MPLTAPWKSGSYLCWVYTVIWFVNSISNQVRQHQKIHWRKGISSVDMDDISHRRLNIIGCKFDTLVGVSAAALITCGICLYFGNFLESSILIFPFSFWQVFFMWNFVSFWQFSHFLESSILPFPLFFWQGGSCRDVGSKKRNPPLLSRFRPWISKKVLCVRPSLHAQTITSSTLPSTNETFLYIYLFLIHSSCTSVPE